MIQENKITTLLLVLSEAKNGFTDENKFHSQILRHSTFHQSCSAEPVVDSSFVTNLGNILTFLSFNSIGYFFLFRADFLSAI